MCTASHVCSVHVQISSKSKWLVNWVTHRYWKRSGIQNISLGLKLTKSDHEQKFPKFVHSNSGTILLIKRILIELSFAPACSLNCASVILRLYLLIYSHSTNFGLLSNRSWKVAQEKWTIKEHFSNFLHYYNGLAFVYSGSEWRGVSSYHVWCPCAHGVSWGLPSKAESGHWSGVIWHRAGSHDVRYNMAEGA